MSHANREGITLKPTQKFATASETINALFLVRRFRLLQTRKIVSPFPMMVRNERTHPRIQNQVSILTIKGSSYQLYNTSNILHKYQGHMSTGTLRTESPSIFPDESGRGRNLCRHPRQFILSMLQIQFFLRRQSNRYRSIHCVCQHM